MTTGELHARTAEWRAARDLEKRLRPGRDTAIREALAAGMTQRAAAVAAGVSKNLPNLIRKETPKP
jgi:hypothetical protein